MARIDYFKIEEELKSILARDGSLNDIEVVIENDPNLNMAGGPFVGIYLDRREAPEDEQLLSAGNRQVYMLYFTILCITYSLEDMAQACLARDELVGKVELVLMKNLTRTANNFQNVAYSFLDGGDMQSGQNPEGRGYVSSGVITLAMKATAINA